MTTENEGLAKRIAELGAQLRESESKLEDFGLQVAKERKVNKELEVELLLYKKEVMEQHKKGF